MPPLRLYWPVLERLAHDYRASGKGWKFRCPFPHRDGRADATPSGWVQPGGRGELAVGCNACGRKWPEFVRFVGLPAAAWWPGPVTRRWRVDGPKPKPVAEYPYEAAAGAVVAVKVRFEPGFHGGKKSFLWKRPLPESVWPARYGPAVAVGPGCLDAGHFVGHQRHGRWEFRQKWDESVNLLASAPQYDLPAVELGLYRLPSILAAKPAVPVIVVEGEKDVETLRACGFVATTGHAGQGKWEPGWAAPLAGRRVVVIPDVPGPDCDFERRQATLRYGCLAAGDAAACGATGFRLVHLPPERLPDGKGDITDYLAAVVGRDAKNKAVRELCAAVPELRRVG